MKKYIKILIFLLILMFGIYHFFYYVDLNNSCVIKIKPSIMEFSNLNIKRAIKTLKYGSPSDYNTLCANVDTIDPNPSCGGFGGGCFYAIDRQAKTIEIGTSIRDLAWTAAIIMHETCHVVQFKENRPLSEDECYRVDDRTIKKLIQY